MSVKLSTPLAEWLIERGFIPTECRRLDIRIHAHDLIVLRYDVFLTGERAAVLAEAFARLAADQRTEKQMYNYSQVFADTLAEFESPYVPGDQGDAGKGQVTARAGYKIFSSMNGNVGYISKQPGQTQYHEIAVDALLDKSDGTGADYLTDELQPDGRRLIKLAYTPYAPPPPGTPLPPANWQMPTEEYLHFGGPLVLKGTTPIPPEPPSDGRPPQYPADADWPPPVILPTWAPEDVEEYGYEWYGSMADNVERIYLNLLWRWSDFKGAANWLKNIREDGMSPAQMTEAIMASDEYEAIHGGAS